MAQEKIIICDDDRELREGLRDFLEMENMTLFCCALGGDLLPALRRKAYDLLLLDLMLPDTDGFELLKKVNVHFSHLPVIMMSARGELHNKVVGLNLGADDYVTKPFDEVELVARIKSHIRRAEQVKSGASPLVVTYKHLSLDTARMTLTRYSDTNQLSGKLYKLALLFLANPGQVFTKEQMYEAAWGENMYDEPSIMVYIRKLRTLFEDDPGNPSLLHTIRGVGYKLE